MITVEFIHPSEHHQYINCWLRQRDMQPEPLPQLGWMVFDDHRPVAAAFIRKCEGDYGILDNLITNPYAEGKLRSECIDKVVETIIEAAKQLKLKALFAYSRDPHTIERSLKFGFRTHNHTLISKELI